MRFEDQLLATARRMPEARNFLYYVETTLFEFWRAVLSLPIDRDQFTARYIRAAERHTVNGVTLEDLPLATIIEDSAGLTLNNDQRQKLREDVASINKRLTDALREG